MIFLFVLLASMQASAFFNVVSAALNFQRSIFRLDTRPDIIVVESSASQNSRSLRVPISRTDGLKLAVEPENSIYPKDLQCKIIYHRVVIERELDEDGYDDVTYRIQFEAIPLDDQYLGRIFLLHEMELKNFDTIEEAKEEAQKFSKIGNVENCFPEVIHDSK